MRGNLACINRRVNKTAVRSRRYITRCLTASCPRQIACSLGHRHYIVNAIRDSHSNEQRQPNYNGTPLKRAERAARYCGPTKRCPSRCLSPKWRAPRWRARRARGGVIQSRVTQYRSSQAKFAKMKLW